MALDAFLQIDVVKGKSAVNDGKVQKALGGRVRFRVSHDDDFHVGIWERPA